MARDRYRYFRVEAHELLEALGQGLLALESGQGDAGLVKALLRHAHTFKGAARVVGRADLGELAHALEDVLSQLRDAEPGAVRLTTDAADHALGLLDSLRTRVAELDAPPAPAPVPSEEPEPGARPQTETPLRSVRVDIDQLDALLETLHEARGTVGRLEALARELVAHDGEPAVRELDRVRESLERQLDALGEDVGALRLVPVRAVVSDLERTARDAARSLGRSVRLSASGTGICLDADVLAALRVALDHIVRNAVVHGIEDARARRADGKPAEGTIELTVERHGARVVIACRDDGRGLDLDAIRESAQATGLLGTDARDVVDTQALTRLLTRGGVSTSDRVTGLAGRGVGLDAVRHSVEQLGGTVEIETTPGQGTCVRLTAPVSLSTIKALAVEGGGGVMLVPLDAVREVVAVGPSTNRVRWTPGGEQLMRDGADPIPWVGVERISSREAGVASDAAQAGVAVVVDVAAGRVALGARRVCGVRTALVRSLPAHVRADACILGAVLDASGHVALVLSPAAIVELATRLAPVSRPAAPPAPRPPPPILVIDDSLTTRMLEQSILESAGYEVDLAVSGEDALEKARRRQYGVFVVDVEMPGMSGFEFVERTRRDPRLGTTPAILVTSCAEPSDKLRGRQVGARGYIVKGEFDQAVLLDTIAELVGEAR